VEGVWQPLLATLLLLAGACGLIAVVHPRWFSVLAQRGSQWIDTNRAVEWLDRRIDIDCYVFPYTRLFGALVLASACFLAFRYLAS
jgi:hypothetical protein